MCHFTHLVRSIDSLPCFVNVFLESKRINPSDTPDYTLIIKVEDLEGKSENGLSDHASVSIVVQQNLWFAPKSIRIDENHEGPYPMKIAEVTPYLKRLGMRCHV